MSFSDKVWDRDIYHERPADNLSTRLYALLLGAFTAAGIGFAAFVSQYSRDWQVDSWPWWGIVLFVVGFLVVSFAGISILTRSDNPVVSAAGYAMIAAASGLLVGPFVAMYTDASVIRVLGVTTLIVLIMGLIGALIPRSLESWHGWLIGGLLVLIVGYFAIPILGIFGINVEAAMTIWDWVGIVLFCAITIFDLNRAMHLPKTLDNAIDSAAAIFLDFVNIFLRMLNVSGDRK